MGVYPVDKSTNEVNSITMPDSKLLTSSDRFLVSADKPDGGSTLALSFELSPLISLAIAGNRYSREAARLFKGRHQESLMTWRVLALLASKQSVTVATATQTTGIDKAAVSRTLNALEESGLSLSEAAAADPRRKTWRLSKAGYALHSDMLETSLDIHRTLLHGLSSTDAAELSRLLTIVSNNFKDFPAD